MKVKKIIDQTSNRGEFNRAYKRYLESKGKIRCGYCKCHSNENNNNKWYGGIKGGDIRYPNWKLVSKNRKQWMKKPISFNEDYHHFFNKRTYIDITW